MTDLNETRVGREEKKGDLSVLLTKKGRGGLSIEIESSVGHMFGEQIRAVVEDTLQGLGVVDADVKVSDMGAFDYVIQARLETAVRRLYEVDGAGVLPKTVVEYDEPIRDRLRRTRLYMPGNNPDLMRNGGLFGADCVILDLEDSVSPRAKDAARLLVRNTLIQIDYGKAERIVRMNPMSTEFGADDLEMIIPARPDTILIPKCETAADVTAVGKIIEKIEKREGIETPTLLMPLIETANGILNAREVGSSSSRVVALCFGAEDFTADIGVARTVKGGESLTARCLLVLGAKASGVQAIDTVFSDVSDTEGLIESTREAMSLGFEGKGVIHPAQIKPIHEVFSPTPDRIEYAKKVVAAIEKARASGSGVASIGSKMVDAPIELRARKILKLAEALGLLGENEE